MTVKQEFIDNLNKVIESNFHNEDFDVKILAQKLNVSRSQLHRNIIKFIGVSAGSYINELRLRNAFELLKQRKLTVSEIAYKVGFSSPSYFSTAFKKRYSFSPNQIHANQIQDTVLEQPGIINTGIEPNQRSDKRQSIYFLNRMKKLKVGIILSILLSVIIFTFISSINRNSANKPSLQARTIAVMPFKNFSGDASMDVFCYGLTDEVISKLSHLTNFDRVSSRTSVFKYKDAKMDVPEIANKLRVRYILEGNIQKLEDKFKVNVQLIDATTDGHVWSDLYHGNWETKDIFEIQEKITEFIAEALMLALQDRIPESNQLTNTINKEAYELYLRAKSFMYSGDETNTEKARNLLNKAILLDTTFAKAYLELGYIWTIDGFAEGRKDQVTAWNKGKFYLNKARQYDSTLEMIDHMLMQGYFYFDWDFNKLESYFQSHFSNDIFDRESSGIIDYAIKTGRFESALIAVDKSIENDALDAVMFSFKARSLWYLGREREGLALLDQILEFNKNDWFFLREAAHSYFIMSEFDKSKQTLDLLFQEFEDDSPMLIWFKLFFADSHQDKEQVSLLLLELQTAYINGESGSPAWFIALYHLSVKNDIEKAFEWLEKSYQNREVELTWFKVEQLLEPLKKDSRYWSLYNKIGFNQIKS